MQSLTLQRSHPEYSHIELEWTSAQSTQPAICFTIIHVSILSSIISKQRNESTLLFRAQKQRSTCSKSKRRTEAIDRVQITRRKNLKRAIDGFAQISITRNNKYVSFGAWASTRRSSECYESSLKKNRKKSTSEREKKKAYVTAKALRHRFARQNHSDDDGIIHMENQSHGKQEVQHFWRRSSTRRRSSDCYERQFWRI